MARYVDIENCGALVDVLANTLEMCHFKHKAGCIALDCRDCLHRHFNEFNSSHLIPTADVRPVTHGYWKPIFDTDADKERGFAMEYECSECGCISRDCTYSHGLDYEICPYCGANMDGEDGNNDLHRQR